jgi:hypothetical protein
MIAAGFTLEQGAALLLAGVFAFALWAFLGRRERRVSKAVDLGVSLHLGGSVEYLVDNDCDGDEGAA